MCWQPSDTAATASETTAIRMRFPTTEYLLYQRRTALAIFALLAIIHTWPLAANPGHLSRIDNADYVLNSWAISWVAHQLPRHPTRLFDANIFYPERRSLAYSEAMIVQGVLAMPVRALGGSAVLAFNLVLLAGLALTSWSFWLLIRRWTGSVAAAYVGGTLAGFNASVLVRLPHLQAQHLEFVPVMLFALDRLLERRQTRDALLLGLGFALQGLTSIYLLVFSTWMLILAVLARAWQWLRRDPLGAVRGFVVAGAVGTLLLSPYLLAYYRLHLQAGFERSVVEAQMFSGSWIDYLSTGARLHFWLWSHRFFFAAVGPAFPGVVCIVLALLAAAWKETRSDPRVVMCAAAAVGCAAISWVPHAPFYPILHNAIPLFRAVRVGGHLGQFVVMMLAIVAGFGMAGLAKRYGTRTWWTALAAGLFLAVNVEALRAPLGYREYTGIPKIYDDVARIADPNVVLAEIPLYSPRLAHGNAPYMLFSTRHWRPILGGYSGFTPASFVTIYDAVQSFPDDGSLVALHGLGVTHVVVHRSRLPADRFAAIAKISSLQLQNDDGEVYLYKLR